MMRCLRPEDSTQYLVVVEKLEHFLQVFAQQTGPVRLHGDLDDRMRHNRAGPLEGMDFGQKGGVDQLGLGVKLIVSPRRLQRRQLITNVIVLQREQGMEHRETHPPVVAEACEIDAGIRIHGQQP